MRLYLNNWAFLCISLNRTWALPVNLTFLINPILVYVLFIIFLKIVSLLSFQFKKCNLIESSSFLSIFLKTWFSFGLNSLLITLFLIFGIFCNRFGRWKVVKFHFHNALWSKLIFPNIIICLIAKNLICRLSAGVYLLVTYLTTFHSLK